jgi:hypothetical protein
MGDGSFETSRLLEGGLLTYGVCDSLRYNPFHRTCALQDSSASFRLRKLGIIGSREDPKFLRSIISSDCILPLITRHLLRIHTGSPAWNPIRSCTPRFINLGHPALSGSRTGPCAGLLVRISPKRVYESVSTPSRRPRAPSISETLLSDPSKSALKPTLSGHPHSSHDRKLSRNVPHCLVGLRISRFEAPRLVSLTNHPDLRDDRS